MFISRSIGYACLTVFAWMLIVTAVLLAALAGMDTLRGEFPERFWTLLLSGLAALLAGLLSRVAAKRLIA